MTVSMRVEGGEQLARNLRGLSERVSNRVLKTALMEAAEPVRDTASSHAARAPGAPDLADHIGIMVARREEHGDVAVVVGPTKEDRSDQPSRDFATQGLFVELGTSDTPAQPFLRTALESNRNGVIRTMSAKLWAALAGAGISSRSSGGGSGL